MELVAIMTAITCAFVVFLLYTRKDKKAEYIPWDQMTVLTVTVEDDQEQLPVAKKTRWWTAKGTPRLWWAVPTGIAAALLSLNALMFASALFCSHCTVPKGFLETFVSWPLRLLTSI